jgi:hypothetical protein
MRRSAITSITASFLLGLVAACATGAGDDPSVALQPSEVTAPTEPAEQVKLPPPSGTSTPETDAGATAKDAGATPPAQDASPPPPPPAPTTPDCSLSDPVVIAKLLLGASPSGSCPCASAGQCCLAGQCL